MSVALSHVIFYTGRGRGGKVQGGEPLLHFACILINWQTLKGWGGSGKRGGRGGGHWSGGYGNQGSYSGGQSAGFHWN